MTEPQRDQMDEARQRLAETTQKRVEAAVQAARLARKAHDEGGSEKAIADILGVTRTTVRRWIGKED